MQQQRGFTLVEIAIVLVIIGLLLGGVLKGQELINSAKVKNFVNDFRTVPVFIYSYQDKFRALPGDDRQATAHLGGSAVSAGVILAAIPAAVAVLSWLFLRERVAPRVWAGVACAVVGIALVSLFKNELPALDQSAPAAQNTSQVAWLGNLLLIGAVLCEASYAVIGKALTGQLSPRRISARGPRLRQRARAPP